MTWQGIALTCLAWAACGWGVMISTYVHKQHIPPLVPGLILATLVGLLGPLMWVVVLVFGRD